MHRLSAEQLNQEFLNKKLSAVEITQYFLNRIEKYDGEIGAFLSLRPEKALETARSLDEKLSKNEPLGSLAGVPIAVKDNIHIRGEKTTCASKFLENYEAIFDATVVELLEKEGAIIVGKTNLDEFAMGASNEYSAFKKVHNPWDLACVPGGSSGGSAAAVSARLVPIALGTDTGGSIRQPAAFCGITGFKPSYGRVSRYGLVAFGSSLDQIGPMTTCVEDAALMMSILGTHDPKDATSLSLHSEEYLFPSAEEFKGKKIGIPYQFLQNLDPEVKEHFDRSIKTLESLGHEIIEVNLDILNYAIATYYIIATAEAAANLARFDGVRYGKRSSNAKSLKDLYELSREEGFGSEVKKRIILGTYVLSSSYQDAFYTQATKVRFKIMEEFEKAFKSCDVIATPTAPGTAFLLDAEHDPLDLYLQDVFTTGVNLARLPAISVPCGFSRNNKPLGLQLIGSRKEDMFVCQFGHAFQSNTNYHQAIPKRYDE